MRDEGLDKSVDEINLQTNEPSLEEWKTNLKLEANETVKIAILGKYFDYQIATSLL